jgi:hypothetical protein
MADKIMPDETWSGAVMKKGEDEIDRKARLLIQQHGSRAALLAADALNQCIDREEWEGRDFWARIVHRIHELSTR